MLSPFYLTLCRVTVSVMAERVLSSLKPVFRWRFTRQQVQLWVIIPLMLILFGYSGAQSFQNQSLKVIVTNSPVVSGNGVTVDLIVRDGQNTITGLNSENFVFNETYDPLSVDVNLSEPLPVALALIVNASINSDLDLIQQTLDSYFRNYYRDGADFVRMYIYDARAGDAIPRVTDIASLEQATSVIEGLRPSRRTHNIDLAIESSLRYAQAIKDATDVVAVQTMYVGSWLPDGIDISPVAGFAAEEDVPFNVIQAHIDRPTEQHFGLALVGGGLYVNNQDASLLDAENLPLGDLQTLFDRLRANRLIYTVSYLPLGIGGETERNASVSVTASDGRQGSAAFTYEFLLENPEVEIISPENFNIGRILALNAETANIDELPIQVQVDFPDGIQRPIASLRLQVLSDFQTTVYSDLILNPVANEAGLYTITWDFSDYLVPNTRFDTQVLITVKDAFDLEGAIARDARLTVNQVTPIPTITPIPTETPTPTITPTPTPQSVVGQIGDLFGASGGDDGGGGGGGGLIGLLLAFIALLLIVIIGLMIALLRRRRAAHEARLRAALEDTDNEFATDPGNVAEGEASATDADSESDEDAEDAAPTPDREKRLYGRLLVLEGLEDLVIKIEQSTLIFGRSPDVDYEIQRPYINNQHCMIIHRAGRFTLRDLNSKNGTYLDGERLPPEKDVNAPVGSEISITKNIRLELYDTKTNIPEEKLQIVMTNRQSQDGVSKTSVYGQLVFRPTLQVPYIDEEDAASDEEYSPI